MMLTVSAIVTMSVWLTLCDERISAGATSVGSKKSVEEETNGVDEAIRTARKLH